MNPKTKYNRPKEKYWLYPEVGYPKSIYWKVVAGNRRLTVLEDHDLVFNEQDEKYLKSL